MARSFYGPRPLWYWPKRFLMRLFALLALFAAIASGFAIFFATFSIWDPILLGVTAVLAGLAWLLGWRESPMSRRGG